jgi:signal-transduction protein with cAMP-binding, CBS, and nucleotidyltransferase domain
MELIMTQTQLVTQALVLALRAPDDEKMQEAARLAAHFSQGLDETEVEQCKADALVAAETWGQA